MEDQLQISVAERPAETEVLNDAEKQAFSYEKVLQINFENNEVSQAPLITPNKDVPRSARYFKEVTPRE